MTPAAKRPAAGGETAAGKENGPGNRPERKPENGKDAERMKVISVTGGVGSGKSEVLRILEREFGAEVIRADEVAHELMEPGTVCLERVVAAFGDSFLDGDGRIDRGRLAAILFSDPQATGRMNAIVHPLVWEEIGRRIAASDRARVVVEAALFDETHNAMFDEIWYVYASEETRVRRLMESRGYTEEKCRAIMASQATQEEYRRAATRVIDNNGTLAEVREELKRALKALEEGV